MKISVITIAYNDRAGLESTVDSVRRQDWPDIEHIIVDGGSTDGSADYLAGLPDAVNWVSEKDGGRYDAMNKGATMASGDLLWFMNSADVFHSEVSVSFVAREYIKRKFGWGYGLSRIVKGDESVGMAGKVPFEKARFLIGGQVIPHQASVFARDFFWSLNGYSTNLGLTADQEFMMRASLKSDPTVWAEVLCDFDVTGAGSTRSAWAHYRDMMRARSSAGIRVTRYQALDTAVSVFFWLYTLVDRIARRPLRRANPRFVPEDNA
ncbi:glycosyltransferase family 2 protein [Arthrobacter sp. UYCo732]|uniref:glycosyltransferase family 2 protein n=1 Tax=Arthrobacter sp. UYCo732 TaxID=3156336 RepID=UPI0033965D1E